MKLENLIDHFGHQDEILKPLISHFYILSCTPLNDEVQSIIFFRVESEVNIKTFQLNDKIGDGLLNELK